MPADEKDSSMASGKASVSSPGAKSATKKKRNLPGMPDPEAEVIALSPKTLFATNRFVCEICNKGFQRDQNLQLHRRGHNLPWKLRQRTSKEVKKKVYVCPESSCVHHDPSRALGDLTGIKKHFCRKHGEKKWKCDKCSKKYAVQSDWKAHSKICGTREYKCDCGTLFSWRDSFIRHRAFCDALAKESSKAQPMPVDKPDLHSDPDGDSQSAAVKPSLEPSPPPPPPPPPPSSPPVSSPPQSTGELITALPVPSQEPSENPSQCTEEAPGTPGLSRSSSSSNKSASSNSSSRSSGFAGLFASSMTSRSLQPPRPPGFTDLMQAMACSDRSSDYASSSTIEPTSLCLAMNQGPSIFRTASQDLRQYAPTPQPAMSATALLQKAAQIGATASNASLLRGLGLVSSSSSLAAQQENLPWNHQSHGQPDGISIAAGLGLGLPCDGNSGLKELMMGNHAMFPPKHTTLDFLGLGMAADGSPNSGLAALITSVGSGVDVGVTTLSYDGSGVDVGVTTLSYSGSGDISEKKTETE
ncbi:protein indeterminate-domain 2-like isoform X1 [Cucurbita pepo subsp. pepo]|uniref:protein indeterminate-domain 2-like isoform X1 n=1 Tax=Cucurbita pepo subsp. pepo TaxID=3664 RepID=UPI000C9D67FE|nr:protein indeterminate-domain 2-like isoform X1 [Cucurbita pepo subsp. pepo]